MSKTAFITGAGGYIGSEVARTLARAGFDIAICDVSEETARKTAGTVSAIGRRAAVFVADVSKSESIDKAMNDAFETFGGLGVMVHVAGGSARIAGKQARYVPLVEQEDYVIETVIGVNLMGAIYASRAAARLMIKQGRGGKIINFGSTVGLNGLRCSSDYAASKGGVMSFTRALAKELGEYKINVNCVAPGVVCRPDVDVTTEYGRNYAFGTNLLGEKCTAEDIANLVEFLASDKSSFITGQTYVIDGGRALSMKGTD